MSAGEIGAQLVGVLNLRLDLLRTQLQELGA
jgi:hypothetical protein